MKSLFDLNLPKEIKISAKEAAKPEVQWTGAVVFLFVRDHVLLIKRSETMPSHRGQIAFVGGHKIEGETPWETAKREFWEETSMDPELLSFAGFLDVVRTSSMSKICPVVCSLDAEPASFIKAIKSNGEWSEALLVPFECLLQKEHWTVARSVLSDSEYLIKFYPIMRNTYLAHSGSSNKDHLLWGATAKMIWNFFKFYGDCAKSGTKG